VGWNSRWGHRAAIVPLPNSGRARAVPWAEVAAQARPTASGRAGTGPSITGPGRARAGPNLRALGRANGPHGIWKSIRPGTRARTGTRRGLAASAP